jgi:hypothetical protein
VTDPLVLIVAAVGAATLAMLAAVTGDLSVFGLAAAIGLAVAIGARR